MLDEVNHVWMRKHLWMFGIFISNYSLALGGAFGWQNKFGPPLDTLWTLAVERHARCAT
jgi:hypothetical protein